jgi:hypothetical protein
MCRFLHTPRKSCERGAGLRWSSGIMLSPGDAPRVNSGQSFDATVQKRVGWLACKKWHTEEGSTLLDLRLQVRLAHRLPTGISIALGNRPRNPLLLHLVDQSGAL